MASAEPKHKGVGLLAVVKGIKANARARALVPAHLLHYLQQPIPVTGWYPERDYHALITLLASSIDAKQVGGDVWAYLGRVGAQRDIGGDQRGVPERSRLEVAGVYRNFRDVGEGDVAGLFLRMSKMWTLYHDTGRLAYMRHRDKPDGVVVRLHDFAFPVHGVADLQTAYMIEYGRLSGFTLAGQLTACGPSGCEWHYVLSGHGALEPSISRLEPWQPLSIPA